MNLNFLRALIFCAALFAGYLGAVHAAPKAVQYASPEAMAQAMNDFSPETGEFKVLSRKPLHIQLTIKPIAEKANQQYAAEDFFRAFLWGVYRTFLHTSAPQVTVTVVSPVAVDGHKKMTVTVTREKALQVARELLGVSGFDGLITERQTWSDAMKRCRYSDMGAPGLQACALAVGGRI